MTTEQRKMPSIFISILMWIVKGIAYLWLVLFIGCLIEYLLVGIVPPSFCSALRFPLGYPDGIAVDVKGDVICVSHFYNRIQIFDKDGNFNRGWFSFMRGGADIIVDGNNLIHVEQREKYAVYTTDGVLRQTRSKDLYAKKTSGVWETKDALGNTYRIQGNWFKPKIIKMTPAKNVSVLISDPWYLWLIGGYFPLFYYPLVVIAIGGLLKLWKR